MTPLGGVLLTLSLKSPSSSSSASGDSCLPRVDNPGFALRVGLGVALAVAFTGAGEALLAKDFGVEVVFLAVAAAFDAAEAGGCLAADARGVLAAAGVGVFALLVDGVAATTEAALGFRGVRGVRTGSSPEFVLTTTADNHVGATATPPAEPTTNFTL